MEAFTNEYIKNKALLLAAETLRLRKESPGAEEEITEFLAFLHAAWENIWKLFHMVGDGRPSLASLAGEYRKLAESLKPDLAQWPPVKNNGVLPISERQPRLPLGRDDCDRVHAMAAKLAGDPAVAAIAKSATRPDFAKNPPAAAYDMQLAHKNAFTMAKDATAPYKIDDVHGVLDEAGVRAFALLLAAHTEMKCAYCRPPADRPEVICLLLDSAGLCKIPK